MKNRNLVIVILAVICAGLLAGVVYTVTKGKSGTQKKQEASAEAGADETESQSGIIEEDGKKYKLNPDIKTVLFMGVDKEEKADLGNNPGENGQSDSLNLLVLNKEEKTAQIIQISRDSMVGIDIYDVTGNRLMTENGQIALQYAYGDGAEESCRLTSEKGIRTYVWRGCRFLFFTDAGGAGCSNRCGWRNYSYRARRLYSC